MHLIVRFRSAGAHRQAAPGHKSKPPIPGPVIPHEVWEPKLFVLALRSANGVAMKARETAKIEAERLVIGLTGASGVAYGIRALEALRELGIESHLVIIRIAWSG